MLAGHAAFGVEALTETFKAAGDDYSHIMVEALADRLAEVRGVDCAVDFDAGLLQAGHQQTRQRLA